MYFSVFGVERGRKGEGGRGKGEGGERRSTLDLFPFKDRHSFSIFFCAPLNQLTTLFVKFFFCPYIRRGQSNPQILFPMIGNFNNYHIILAYSPPTLSISNFSKLYSFPYRKGRGRGGGPLSLPFLLRWNSLR